jgi:hypothetical protein
MSNLSTLPKGDSAWLLRKAIERIIQQVSVLETNIGSSTTGNSANTQIIFNDNGTLRGDAGLTYNKTTDLLTVGAATITGDLTVDTSTLKVDSANDRVGIGTASPAQFVHLSKSSTSTALTAPPVGGASLRIQNTSSTNNNFGSVEFYNANGLFGGSVNCQFTNQATPTNDLVFVTRGSSGGLEHYRIAADGVCTWSEVGGVAGTAMTLNSTGLGVGVTPAGTGGCLQLKSGITFPATQVASSDANTLDDYEEGTWTPTGSSAVNCTSVSVVAARYTKIGRIVTLSGNVTASVTVANTLTYVTLTGLPFNNAAVVSGSCFENNILAVGFSDVESNNAYLFFPATSELTTGSKSFFFEVTYHV